MISKLRLACKLRIHDLSLPGPIACTKACHWKYLLCLWTKWPCFARRPAPVPSAGAAGCHHSAGPAHGHRPHLCHPPRRRRRHQEGSKCQEVSAITLQHKANLSVSAFGVHLHLFLESVISGSAVLVHECSSLTCKLDRKPP